MPSFLSGLKKGAPGSRLALVDARGQVLVPVLELAVESATRKKGLLGRNGLGPGEGLLIAPTNAVHTFFMRFPIDIVFVARNGRVVKVSRAVPAWRMAAAWGGYAVVELAAGGADRAGIKAGDRVAVRGCEG
jgi:uncharacterized membrane protein (UPF0127 family)